MQDLVVIADIMRNISIGVLIAGLFYTFGMFVLGRVFAIVSDHDIGHDIDHDIDHDIGHDIDHDADHDMSHDMDIGHEVDADSHSGFFEFSQNTPFGVTIGTSLVSFGFLGTIIYYPGIDVSFFIKLALHFLSVALVVYSVRGVLGRVFIESGFNITPRHLVGKEVTAVSTINDGFGEVRTVTEMGPRRFHARPFIKDTKYKKGDDLWVISANDKFVYVDSRKDAKKWTQEQSRTEEPTQ